jgi:hypothetical protein
MKNIPFLAVKGVYDLNLVSRTSRITQIFGAHLSANPNWGLVRSKIVNNFLPPRVKEKFLSSRLGSFPVIVLRFKYLHHGDGGGSRYFGT